MTAEPAYTLFPGKIGANMPTEPTADPAPASPSYDDLNAAWVAALHEVNRLRYTADRLAWKAADEAERAAWNAMQAFNGNRRGGSHDRR